MSESPLKFSLNAPNWDIVNLKDASVFIKDGTHGTHERVLEGIPLLSAKNISPLGTITIDDDDSLISEDEYNKIHSKYELKKNDLLITVVGTLGRSALVASNKRFSIQRSIGVIRCLEANVRPEFLYQFTGTDYFQSQLVLRSNATAQAGIYLGELAKIEVPRPPLPEQKKIAAILSSVDEVIEKTRAQIDKLKDLKTGMMQELLTKGIGHTEFKDSPVGRIPVNWNMFCLEHLVNPDKIITYGIVQAGPHHEGGVPYIRVSDMTQRYLGINGMLRTSPAIALKYKRSSVSTGDIVYALRGVIGHVQLVPPELEGANLTQGTARISPNERVNSRYLLWAMKSPFLQLQNDLEAKGSTFKEITLASLRKLQITLPPLKEQEVIASVMDSVERKLFSAEDRLEHFQNLKKALMQDLLTGKVRVQVDTRELADA